MAQAQPLITAVRVEAFTASALRLLGWLFALIVRLAATGRSARLREILSRAERGVESILFLKAVALYGPLPPRRKRHPRSTQQGFRRIENSRLRLFYRNAKIRARKATVLKRVIALIDALTRPERAVAYFFKRICKGLRLARIVPNAPPAMRRHDVCPAPAPTCADTS
jgi:hypothetical protein